MDRRISRAAGFTLVEMLIAFTLSGVLILAVAKMITFVSFDYAKRSANFAAETELGVLFQRVHKDLRERLNTPAGSSQATINAWEVFRLTAPAFPNASEPAPPNCVERSQAQCRGLALWKEYANPTQTPKLIEYKTVCRPNPYAIAGSTSADINWSEIETMQAGPAGSGGGITCGPQEVPRTYVTTWDHYSGTLPPGGSPPDYNPPGTSTPAYDLQESYPLARSAGGTDHTVGALGRLSASTLCFKFIRDCSNYDTILSVIAEGSYLYGNPGDYKVLKREFTYAIAGGRSGGVGTVIR